MGDLFRDRSILRRELEHNGERARRWTEDFARTRAKHDASVHADFADEELRLTAAAGGGRHDSGFGAWGRGRGCDKDAFARDVSAESFRVDWGGRWYDWRLRERGGDRRRGLVDLPSRGAKYVRVGGGPLRVRRMGSLVGDARGGRAGRAGADGFVCRTGAFGWGCGG